ncbi:phosphoglycerate dehydrogenase [Micrococcus porci]|uniref:phosphoglycerate dehydrogenase n=1 Tax=Micrococcus TaxID=1269 RepID=UPI001CCCE4A3|nr:phosphoglycerate dehydrogenase [Micrococcus porci]MCG7421930.1 phosphoglycerate dehydrogenase [Micrococcus sp. ACRRV]UBH24198.1 phosphoglycerate dehydrogenase [Micrococcus porci]
MSAAKPVVLIAEELSPATVEALGPDFEIRHTDGADRARLLADLPGVDAVLIRSATTMDAEAIAVAKDLKVIARAGVGLDNVEVPAATAAGVMVVNAPTSNIVSAAELTCGHILSVARNIAPANRALKAGEWKRSKYAGVELFEKKLGVIGLGRIGALVAERMKAFGMEILAYDPYISAARAQQLGATLLDLDELLAQSDFITVHMPKTPETVGMISDAQFATMKDTAFIVNVARGGLIDEDALDRALESGAIAGAGVDVFSSEPATDLAFFRHDTAVVTPHLGASTAEAQEKAGVAVAKSVRLALAGELVPDAVNVAGGVIHEDVRPGLPLAEKLARVLRALAGERSLASVDVEVAGEIAVHDVKALRLAALKGVFTDVVSDQVSYVNAPVLAEQRGVGGQLTTAAEAGSYRNTVTVAAVTDEGERLSVTGTLTGPKQVEKLVGVGRHEMEVALAEHMLLFRYADRPGVVGVLGQSLGEQGVNIAGMDVSRDEQGSALAVLTLDAALAPGTAPTLAAAIDADRAAEVNLAD